MKHKCLWKDSGHSEELEQIAQTEQLAREYSGQDNE